MGLLYAYEDGLEIDLHEAERWFRLAAEQDRVAAQQEMGDLYVAPYEVEPGFRRGDVLVHARRRGW